MNLVPLYEEAIQFNNFNGTVLAAGKVEVWYLGRTRKADIYADVAGETPLPNPFDLNNLGMQEVYVNPAFNYTLVVYDAYGSELFAVDKYLQGAGGHTTSNVVVQPSESIAVSAWTVGEVQIYQPYLVGEVGKTYEGIDPIVVNNEVNRISANHIPLGVQDPLYFVQDDEEACIIGLSGGTVDPNEFIPWSASGTFQTAGDYYSASNPSGFITGVDLTPYAKSEDLTAYQEKGDYYSASNPSGFITGVDLTDYAKTEDLTAYQEKGDYYSASNPSGFINSDAISAMATTGFVAGVSADITALIPTDLFTKESADTLYQPIGSYQEALTFNYTNDDEISGINGSAIYGQGGGVTGDYELKEGNGIQLTDDPINQTTTISVSGDYATNAQLQTVSGEITALIPTALTGEYLDKASADTLYYPLETNPNGYLTAETDWSDTITAASANAYNEATAAIPTGLATEDWVTAQGYLTAHQDLSDYQTTAGMTAYQEAGDYLTANALDSVSGDWNEVSAKLDTTAFSDVSGTFLTAHQDISNKLDTTAFSDVSGSFLTAVPDTYLQNTDLATADGKVTAISGIPLSAGGEQVQSDWTVTAVDSPAYILNKPTEKNLIAGANVTISESGDDVTIETTEIASGLQLVAGKGVTLTVSGTQIIAGLDETVLWVNTNNEFTKNLQWPQTLSEPITNFEKVAFLYAADDYIENAQYHIFNAYNNFNYNLVEWRCDGPSNDNIFWREAKFNCNGTSLTNPYNSTINLSTAFNGGGFNRDGYNWLLKVIGINRISS